MASVIVALFVGANMPAAAEPSITISCPTDGARLLDRTVNVTGTASAPEQSWLETARADFDCGTYDNTTSSPSGDMRMTGGMYDDFNDNLLDPDWWTGPNDTGGMSSAETGGQFQTHGTYNGSVNETCKSRLESVILFDHEVSATLVFLCGTGDSRFGFYTAMGISNGTSWFEIGVRYENAQVYIYDASQNPPGIGWSGHDGWVGDYSYSPHRFSLQWDRKGISLYVDDAFIRQYKVQSYGKGFGSYHAYLRTTTYYANTPVNAQWDDVSMGEIFFGNYTSAVHDTGTRSPELKNVILNASIPKKTSILATIRSSDSPGMEDATDWCPVENNQSQGFPALKRYVQYRLNFFSAHGSATPILHDISFAYTVPILKVEVGINSDWQQAFGTSLWSACLDIPENDSYIFAKVTDGAGETAIASVRVVVDTVPPNGTIILNNGDLFTRERRIYLYLLVADSHMVTSMIISEDMNFNGSTWQDFSATFPLNLSEGDGIKAVYAKFRDTSGLESETANGSIILDGTPPKASLVPLPRAVATTNFTVYWSGSDVIGPIYCYHVQYRMDNGPWTDWLTNTKLTSCVFPGRDGHRYSFRVQAQDQAGNISPYEESGGGPVLVHQAGRGTATVDRSPSIVLVLAIVSALVAMAWFLKGRKPARKNPIR